MPASRSRESSAGAVIGPRFLALPDAEERVREQGFVYCSLGTIVTFKYLARSKLVIQAFLDAVAARPNWQGIGTIGRFLSASDLRVPPNA